MASAQGWHLEYQGWSKLSSGAQTQQCTTSRPTPFEHARRKTMSCTLWSSPCYVGKGMVGWCHNIDSHRSYVHNIPPYLAQSVLELPWGFGPTILDAYRLRQPVARLSCTIGHPATSQGANQRTSSADDRTLDLRRTFCKCWPPETLCPTNREGQLLIPMLRGKRDGRLMPQHRFSLIIST